MRFYLTVYDMACMLSFSLTGMKTQTICLVTELKMSIPIQNLKPLTMTNVAKDIIVAYSVRDDNTKFAILRTRDTHDKHRITLLEVQFELSEISLVELDAKRDAELRINTFTEGGHEINEATVEELEMCPDGDILNTTGQIFTCLI